MEITLHGTLDNIDSSQKNIVISTDNPFTLSYMKTNKFKVKYKSVWNLICYKNKEKKNRIILQDLLNLPVHLTITTKFFRNKRIIYLSEIWGDFT